MALYLTNDRHFGVGNYAKDLIKTHHHQLSLLLHRPAFAQFLPIASNRRRKSTTKLYPAKMQAQKPPTTDPDMALGFKSIRETRDPISLPVTGHLPPYLGKSSLYRVGPGRYDVQHADKSAFQTQHWFDGLSIVHAFQLNGPKNTVSYHSRMLTDSMIRAIEGVPRDRYNEISFGSPDPCRTLLGRFFQLWTPAVVDPQTGLPPIPNIGVTVQNIPGKGVIVRTDSTVNHSLNEQNLEINHFFRFEDIDTSLKGIMSSAHGHYDVESGEFFNFAYDLTGARTVPYHVFKILPDGTAKILAHIMEKPSYLHSFAVTENYFVLIVWPLRISTLRVLWTRNILDASSFQDNEDAKFYVISRHGDGHVATYTAPPFFCFHTINAFERDGNVYIDLCWYKNGDVLRDFMLQNMMNEQKRSPSSLMRFTLSDVSTAMTSFPETARASQDEISACDMELPRINGARYRKDYQFVYGVVSSKGGFFHSVGKVDVVSGECVTWGKDRVFVGEPVFVADPDGVDEDDGCLLVVVLDAEIEKSSVVVLDAKSMTEIAAAQVPQTLPFGFHGMFKVKDIPS